HDTRAPESSPLPLHDALPIWLGFLNNSAQRFGYNTTKMDKKGCKSSADRSTFSGPRRHLPMPRPSWLPQTSFPSTLGSSPSPSPDRKSTRLNSSHVKISYAVF